MKAMRLDGGAIASELEDAFHWLLVSVADRTAKGAKEGGFIGFGGQ
jgi:hypothetical protein